MPLATSLISLVGPVVSKILVQLGIGAITYVGMSDTLSAILLNAKTQFLGLDPVYLQLMAIGGVPQGLGMISGAMTARLAYSQTKKFVIK